MNRRVTLAKDPLSTLVGLHQWKPVVAEAIERVLDLIEAEPVDVSVRKRMFSRAAGNIWVVNIYAAGEDWTILWDEITPGEPFIHLIAETTSV